MVELKMSFYYALTQFNFSLCRIIYYLLHTMNDLLTAAELWVQVALIKFWKMYKILENKFSLVPILERIIITKEAQKRKYLQKENERTKKK